MLPGELLAGFLHNSLGVKALICEGKDQDFCFLLAQEGLKPLFLFPKNILAGMIEIRLC